MVNGCVIADKVVNSETRAPRFESRHHQFLLKIYKLLVVGTEKTKIKKGIDRF